MMMTTMIIHSNMNMSEARAESTTEWRKRRIPCEWKTKIKEFAFKRWHDCACINIVEKNDTTDTVIDYSPTHANTHLHTHDTEWFVRTEIAKRAVNHAAQANRHLPVVYLFPSSSSSSFTFFSSILLETVRKVSVSLMVFIIIFVLWFWLNLSGAQVKCRH